MKPENQADAGSPKVVPCPTCGGNSIYAPGNAFRPFCSERCKNIDLGAWASENFRMPDEGVAIDPETDLQARH